MDHQNHNTESRKNKQMNILPRRILNYKTTEELFEMHFDGFYSA